MKRKIIQIAVREESGVLYALCDDGSLWITSIHTDGEWRELDGVPQS